uniref:putative uncharacterized protein DDB_G0277255 n=1 Tax=Erigeron canadensis TaxID=72917 RepID=UPI001CB8D8E6|nr:putative uncharacterized protein DDB_G0277255 [Erigeron canadensis]
MTDDNYKRKKKRGRKNNFSCSCFPSLITPTEHNNNCLDNDNDAHITKNGRVLIPLDNDRVVRKQSSHRSHIPRLVKAVLFGSLMAKKIHRSSSSKSSSMASSDTNGSYITYDKTGDDDNNTCVKECNDNTDETSSRCRSNLLTSSSSSSSTNCSSNSYTTSSCSTTSTFSTSRSSSQQKSSSQIDLVDFRHPDISSKSFLLDQKVSSRLMDHPRHHLRHQDSSASVSLPLSNPKPMKKFIHKSLSFQKGISQLDSLLLDSSSSFPSLTNLNRDKIRNNNNGNNILWCFFLFLSLVVLVVYGRIFSILCTSTWLYFVPCLRIKRVNSSTNMTAFVDTDSEQYKKRVIMAGLLDRTRNPFR